MKKLLTLVIAAILFCNISASAQTKGDFAVGGGISLGTLLPTMGIGGVVQYNISDPIRLSGNLDYFIKNKGVNTFDITVDCHYLFPLSDKFSVYPLAGVGVSILFGDGPSRVPFVANIGGGVQYNISQRLHLTFEIKGRLGNGVCQAVLGPNLVYSF